MASFVPVSEAQLHFHDLLDRAERGEEIVIRGEEIVIRREGHPSTKLTPLLPEEEPRKGRTGGQNLLGITYIAPDFDDPMTDKNSRSGATDQCVYSWIHIEAQSLSWELGIKQSLGKLKLVESIHALTKSLVAMSY